MSNLNIETFYKSFPTLGHKRNRFPFEKEINYNMKMGEITPICAIPVVPGQTYHLNLANVIKVAPLSVPPMDTAVFKAFAFYQSNRNTWDNYIYWFGEKKYPENPEKEPTYLVPKIKMPSTGCKYNGFFDNIGIPPTAINNEIDAYLPRMDRQIYNTYFRNQSLENALEVNTGDENEIYTEEQDTLRKICRPRDLFAQALPNQSGSEPVEIPLGSIAPVIGNGTTIGLMANGNTQYGLTATAAAGGAFVARSADSGKATGSNPTDTGTTASGKTIGLTTDPNLSGMVADLSKAMGAPLEGLYQAIAYNTMQYITSRSGNRYFEQLSNIYGCVNPDGVLRLPEFLGSTTQMIDFDTITQTSQTEGQPTGLGSRGANGYLESYDNIINKSFGEFGWIIIYGVITHYPKYQQGISKLMQTTDPLELFNPIFNLMGDEALFKGEIYAQDPSIVNSEGISENDEVWGYGKRNSRILYPINEVHGEQRSSYPQSLDASHFGEYYSSAPNLNKDWDKINDNSFKRALSVTDETQFICNALITGIQDIEIPLNPIPSPIPDVLMHNQM